MERAGAVVRAFAADVADPDAVAEVVATVRREMAPLRGVIHAAAVIEDAPILNVTSELLARVFEPKTIGAWNLHAATLADELETFVLYSSVSVLVGNPGQAAYVAANAYLESLAQYRRARGLPALAVGWGAIADAGFLTRNAAVADMLKKRSGLEAMPVAEALADLGRLLAGGTERVCIARLNLPRLAQVLGGTRVPRFAPILPHDAGADGEAAETLAERLKTIPAAERRSVIVARICEHAGHVLGTGAGRVEIDRPLSEMGLDSLMAVELAEAVEREVAHPVSVMEMLGAGTVGAIADLVLRTLALGGDDDSLEVAPTPGAGVPPGSGDARGSRAGPAPGAQPELAVAHA
jgi:acyl carrier protein